SSDVCSSDLGAALAVGVVGLALPGGDDVQGFPVGVAAAGQDLPAQVGGDAGHVLHQAGGVGEGVGVDPLQDPAPAVVRSPDRKGIVDVACAVALGLAGGQAKVEGGGGLAEQFLGDWFHDAIPPLIQIVVGSAPFGRGGALALPHLAAVFVGAD